MPLPYFSPSVSKKFNYKPVYLTKKEQIKKLLEGDLELLNEIVIELRKEKISKINEKIYKDKRR